MSGFLMKWFFSSFKFFHVPYPYSSHLVGDLSVEGLSQIMIVPSLPFLLW